MFVYECLGSGKLWKWLNKSQFYKFNKFCFFNLSENFAYKLQKLLYFFL